MSKSVDEINNHSITISIQHEGKAVRLSAKDKKFIINAIKETLKDKLKENDYLQILILSDNTAIFQRGKRHKRFTPEQAQAIREENLSIRGKALKYNSSTDTISRIMRGEY